MHEDIGKAWEFPPEGMRWYPGGNFSVEAEKLIGNSNMTKCECEVVYKPVSQAVVRASLPTLCELAVWETKSSLHAPRGERVSRRLERWRCAIEWATRVSLSWSRHVCQDRDNLRWLKIIKIPTLLSLSLSPLSLSLFHSSFSVVLIVSLTLPLFFSLSLSHTYTISYIIYILYIKRLSDSYNLLAIICYIFYL